MVVDNKRNKNSDCLNHSSLEFHDTSVQVPFLLLLPGETPLIIEKILPNDCLIITNYRLIISSQNEILYLIPNYLIWKLEYIELVYINIITKHGLTFKLKFLDNLRSSRCFNRLSELISIPQDIENLFAFKFFYAVEKSFCDDGNNCPFLKGSELCYDVNKEFSRMKFSNDVWYVADVNKDFKLCPSYPEYHILPKCMIPHRMRIIAEFRSGFRFPSVVWRSQKTGAVIFRCSQPCVGLMFWRNEEDETFAKEIIRACEADGDFEPANPRRLQIVDARNYHAAQLNRFKGGGFEFMAYYERTDINFMGLPNIHTVRDSFEKLTALFSSKCEINWLTLMEKTVWLGYLGQLIKSSLDIATSVQVKGWPVMVHCTDGWDRTPQLVSLAQIMIDPFYRTIQGFRVLVQREWLDFGHKFADRCGHGVGSESTDERCPIFLQWLDCVHQLHRQFPECFQFNRTFLLKLCHHVYSTLFGTFLCNTLKERKEANLSTRTASVWNFLHESSNHHIINYTFRETEEMLCPQYQQSSLALWTDLFKSPPECWSERPTLLTPKCANLTVSNDGSLCNLSPTLRRSQSDAELSVSSSSLTSCSATGDLPNSETAADNVGPHHVRSQSLTIEEQIAAATANIVRHSSKERPQDLSNSGDNSCSPSDVSVEVPVQCQPHFTQLVPRLSDLSKQSLMLCQPHTASQPNVIAITVDSVRDDPACPTLPNKMSNTAADGSAACHSGNSIHLQSLEASITSTLKDEDRGSSRDASPGRDERNSCNSSSSSNYSSSHSPSPNWQNSFFQSYSLSDLHQSVKLNPAKLQSDMDYDGLSRMNDPITEFIHSVKQNQRKTLDKRKKELYQLKRNLDAEKERHHSDLKTRSQRQENCHNSRDSTRSSSESSQASNSYEIPTDVDLNLAVGISADFDKIQVERGYTCWVPDHLVSACSQCTVTFTMRFRKHHCRSCGNVFCANCSNFFLPLPEQQINRQVRVCQSCYVKRRHDVLPEAALIPLPATSPLSLQCDEIERAHLAEEELPPLSANID